MPVPRIGHSASVLYPIWNIRVQSARSFIDELPPRVNALISSHRRFANRGLCRDQDGIEGYIKKRPRSLAPGACRQVAWSFGGADDAEVLTLSPPSFHGARVPQPAFDPRTRAPQPAFDPRTRAPQPAFDPRTRAPQPALDRQRVLPFASSRAFSNTIVEHDRKASRRARLAHALSGVIGLSIACTLTQDDFQPNEVSALENAPGEVAGTRAIPPNTSCTSATGCCSSTSDCSAGQDCVDGVCRARCSPGEDPSACTVPFCSGPDCGGESSCMDGMANGREPAVDCGETCPTGCENGSACNVDADCQSLRCVTSRCAAPTCSDGVRNQNEAAIDCGGSCPLRCSTGQSCNSDADCAVGLFCPPETSRCTNGSCQDGSRNGGELWPDCGGGECPGCPVGAPCSGPRDCLSRACADGSCREASCSDGISSGDESDIDCGGSDPDCTRCGDGATCSGPTDCENGTCEAGTCISCSDGRQNGSETGTDCGGPNTECARCEDGQACAIGDDCEGDRCVAGTCAAPRCDDGIQNGGESDVDCGGNGAGCRRCGPRESCTVNGDCANLSCSSGACAACDDGIRNGAETDTDCGGADASCARCSPGASCQADADCASGACQDGRCCGGSLGDCTRCAERLSANFNCDAPLAGTDSTGVMFCNAFLACLINNPSRCPTRNTPGCSGDDQVNDACPHNDFGGNAGTGLTRANLILQNAGCQL
jgi:hypothetical protein